MFDLSSAYDKVKSGYGRLAQGVHPQLTLPPLRAIIYCRVPGLLVKIHPVILAAAGHTLTIGLLIASWALVTFSLVAGGAIRVPASAEVAPVARARATNSEIGLADRDI